MYISPYRDVIEYYVKKQGRKGKIMTKFVDIIEEDLVVASKMILKKLIKEGMVVRSEV